MERKTTLREFLHSLNVLEKEVDVTVDGTDTCICIVGGEIKLTPEAEHEFKDCLDNLYVENSLVYSTKNSDYDVYDKMIEAINNDDVFDEECILSDAETLVLALAGYCSCADYSKWFEGNNAKLI